MGEAADREHKLADEAKAQTKLAAGHLQNALDLLEPLSMTVKAEHHTKVADRQAFLTDFSNLTSKFYQKLLADQENPDREVRRQIGRAFHGQGLSHAVLKERPAAEEAFRKAIALQENLVNEFPEEAAYRVDLAVSYQSAGDEYQARKNEEKAGEYYAKIPKLFKALPPDPQRAQLFSKLSEKLANMGRYPEALDWLARVAEQLESMLEVEQKPNVREAAAISLAAVYHARAVNFMMLDKPIEAEREFDRAAHVKEAKVPPEVAKMWQQLRMQNWLALMLKKVMPAQAK